MNLFCKNRKKQPTNKNNSNVIMGITELPE